MPSLLVFAAVLFRFGNPVALFEQPLSPRTMLVAAFTAHYIYRILIFPSMIRGGKPTPLTVWAISGFYCVWNGFIQVS
jgi:3-oxo-5-alpha-steroid 4-dehydrogenase 1